MAVQRELPSSTYRQCGSTEQTECVLCECVLRQRCRDGRGTDVQEKLRTSTLLPPSEILPPPSLLLPPFVGLCPQRSTNVFLMKHLPWSLTEPRAAHVNLVHVCRCKSVTMHGKHDYQEKYIPKKIVYIKIVSQTRKTVEDLMKEKCA